MRNSLIPIIALVGLVSFRPDFIQGQTSLENDKMRLEIVGLKRWTIPMIQDSLTKYSPHDLLLSHACAAILRDNLNFAEASVNIFPGGYEGRSKDLVMVTVVEPQDSQLVSYRNAFPDSVPTRPEWADALHFIESRSEIFQTVIQRPEQLKTDSARPLARFLREHSRASDYSTAVRTLARDKNWENRLVAVVLLRTFASQDRTWWAYADALRDPNGRVAATASQVLRGMSVEYPRRVNWLPASRSLRTLLNGTSLSTQSGLMKVLTVTKINPKLARPLLKNGGELVVGRLATTNQYEKETAYEFLRQISARHLPDSYAVWKEWIQSL